MSVQIVDVAGTLVVDSENNSKVKVKKSKISLSRKNSKCVILEGTK